MWKKGTTGNPRGRPTAATVANNRAERAFNTALRMTAESALEGDVPSANTIVQYVTLRRMEAS